MIKTEFESTDRRGATSAQHLIGRIVGATVLGGDTREHERDLPPMLAADVEVRHEHPHAQQSMDILGAEPLAKQIILRADRLSCLLEAVAAEAIR